jgi:hypothetical protein
MRKGPSAAAGAGLAAAQRAFDELAESGAPPAELERFIAEVFVERNRTIRDADFRLLNPATVADDYLRPRRDLYCFAVVNWMRRIFIPSLKPRVAEAMLVFGLGRLFSAYNDMGVQDCTDADINVVVDDGLGSADRAYLAQRLKELKRELYDRFAIVLDLDPSYTLLRAKEVVARLRSRDAAERSSALRFYKSNERSIAVIKDHEALRELVFSIARAEPDSRLFENFLGLRGGASYASLRSGAETLPVLVEGGERVQVGTLIGSRPFELYCRRLFPRDKFLSPPDWTFSMKYFVNRVYDYAGAMRGIGRTLEEIGFDRPDRRLGGDPDYLYLRNAHKLMLYLQELITTGIGSYNDAMCDYTYVSRARFMRLMEIHADKFRRDFDEMVSGGGLLSAGAKKRYDALRQKIRSRSRDRFLEMSVQERARLPAGFKCETVYRDARKCRICVPYSWGDLGYFVFSSIASRMAKIVDERLAPRLPSLGMAEEDYLRHLAALEGDAPRP